jgi:hypothetical protein
VYTGDLWLDRLDNFEQYLGIHRLDPGHTVYWVARGGDNLVSRFEQFGKIFAGIFTFGYG